MTADDAQVPTVDVAFWTRRGPVRPITSTHRHDDLEVNLVFTSSSTTTGREIGFSSSRIGSRGSRQLRRTVWPKRRTVRMTISAGSIFLDHGAALGS